MNLQIQARNWLVGIVALMTLRMPIYEVNQQLINTTIGVNAATGFIIKDATLFHRLREINKIAFDQIPSTLDTNFKKADSWNKLPELSLEMIISWLILFLFVNGFVPSIIFNVKYTLHLINSDIFVSNRSYRLYGLKKALSFNKKEEEKFKKNPYSSDNNTLFVRNGKLYSITDYHKKEE